MSFFQDGEGPRALRALQRPQFAPSAGGKKKEGSEKDWADLLRSKEGISQQVGP